MSIRELSGDRIFTSLDAEQGTLHSNFPDINVKQRLEGIISKRKSGCQSLEDTLNLLTTKIKQVADKKPPIAPLLGSQISTSAKYIKNDPPTEIFRGQRRENATKEKIEAMISNKERLEEMVGRIEERKRSLGFIERPKSRSASMKPEIPDVKSNIGGGVAEALSSRTFEPTSARIHSRDNSHSKKMEMLMKGIEDKIGHPIIHGVYSKDPKERISWHLNLVADKSSDIILKTELQRSPEKVPESSARDTFMITSSEFGAGLGRAENSPCLPSPQSGLHVESTSETHNFTSVNEAVQQEKQVDHPNFKKDNKQQSLYFPKQTELNHLVKAPSNSIRPLEEFTAAASQIDFNKYKNIGKFISQERERIEKQSKANTNRVEKFKTQTDNCLEQPICSTLGSQLSKFDLFSKKVMEQTSQGISNLTTMAALNPTKHPTTPLHNMIPANFNGQITFGKDKQETRIKNEAVEATDRPVKERTLAKTSSTTELDKLMDRLNKKVSHSRGREAEKGNDKDRQRLKVPQFASSITSGLEMRIALLQKNHNFSSATGHPSILMKTQGLLNGSYDRSFQKTDSKRLYSHRSQREF